MTPFSQFEAHWPEISALLDEALNLPPADHAAWIAGLTGERAAHREALTALLASRADMETDDFLVDGPKLGDVADASGARLVEGTQIGAYRLISEIGRGGMGTVWLAERADGMMKRRLALKLPRAVWGDAFAERLGREREILASLEHEHIARLYDAGVDAQGRPFLAMEFVEGEPIDAYCRAHALSVRERVALLLQVMAAVAHAHARLVVHRDLKPANILVSIDGRVKLLDFGIAKLLEGDRTHGTALTELGGRALTPDYASPEQIRGEPLGTASDVYSMAVVAFELLTGARPYRIKRGSAAEIEEAIASAEPPLASDVAADSTVARLLRGDLDSILNKGLKKNAEERYRTLDAFADDLRRWLAGATVTARPDRLGYRTRKFVARYRLQVAAGGAVVAALLVGTTVALWQAHEARRQERLAVLEADKQSAVTNLYRETMSRVALLAQKEPGRLTQPHAVTALLRQQLRDNAASLANQPEALGAQMLAVFVQLLFEKEPEAALAVGKDYLAHLKAHGAPPFDVIRAYFGLSKALYQMQRFDESEEMSRAAVAWAPDVNDRHTELARAEAATTLGNNLRVRGKREEALAVLTNAEKVAARKFPNEFARFENLRMLATFWFGFDDSRALRAIEQGHAGYLKIANDDQKAQELLSFGNILFAQGRTADAEAALRASADVFARVNGRTSRDVLRAIGPLSFAIAVQGDTSRAQRLLADTLLEMSAEPSTSATAQSRELRRRRLDIAWLTGELSSVDGLSADEVTAFTAPAAIRSNEALLLAQARLWALAGRGRDAVALLSALRQGRPDAGKPTLGWVQLLAQQANAELAANDPAAARATAGALMALLEQSDARAGMAYRVAAETAALAATRLGDRSAAEQALARADAAVPPPAFASPIEHAESSLRRAEVQTTLGHDAEARAAGRAALADLAGQHNGSPRLAQARRFAGLDFAGS